MEPVTLILVLGVVAAVTVVALFAAGSVAKNLLYICEPNEVLIFSGLRRKTEGGALRGYRVIRGGRAWRVPLLERVDRMDLTNMIIEVAVQGAYSKGGIPLNVQGVANIKVASDDPVLGAAVERLLLKKREEIARIAKDVLEGNLRGVLSQLTPEEVNEDKLAFAEKLEEEAAHDLARLGLVLDTMKIQNVHDDRGYLDSLGRRSSAEIVKKSRIAEAKAKATAIMRDAENRKRARLEQIAAEEQINTAQAERRIGDARTRTVAMVAEATGQVGAEVAKAEAGMEAEEARVEQTRRRLEADVIEPAKANLEAGVAQARGKASRVLEEGRATVQVLEEMIGVWRSAGADARDIFLMQKLHKVMGSMASTIGTVKVDRVTMLPAGAGGETSRQAVRLVEELKGALGVDLPKMLTDFSQSRAKE
ncbi:MAG: flotillin family protein [Deltaproteobacteria bacterium]|nr:flotillin family protein [Deltaproteobacteria bacterium]